MDKEVAPPLFQFFFWRRAVDKEHILSSDNVLRRYNLNKIVIDKVAWDVDKRCL